MGVHSSPGYFKRYRMDVVLPAAPAPLPDLPAGYRFVAWHDGLLDAHARTKFRAFRSEIDAVVFPCLGDLEGCRRLMREIRGKVGFLPAASWLVARAKPVLAALEGTGGSLEPGARAPLEPGARAPLELEWCATIQGVIDANGHGSIQNIGVVPTERGRGLGTALVAAALHGFAAEGAPRAWLEVTADNVRAVRLYQRLGFRRTRTIFKTVDGPVWPADQREAVLL
ncbi:MAG: GNAT family N-acetyltransferase [Planctomycetaceae bacterium]